MAKAANPLREAVHVCAQRYRQYAGDRRAKKEFERHCKTLGLELPWKDYLRARKQTGCEVREYFAFEFYKKDDAQRDTYLTLQRHDAFTKAVGVVNRAITIPGNKVLFNMIFGAFLQREWINPSACTAEEFIAFVKKHGRVMVKPSDSCSGKGIHIFAYEDDEKTRACYDELVGTGALAEELLKQHPQMDRLNPHCINTVRVATYTDRDDVHILFATARSGMNESIVDNFGAGGVSVAVDWKTGKIIADAIDQEYRRIATLPMTGTTLQGFQIPNWGKALDVVRRAARLAYTLPQCHWIGWDLAFLANDEVAIVEGNWRQGPLSQNTHPKGIYHELKELSKKL